MDNQDNNAKKTIGVLGGMGPVATAYFYEKLIEHGQKKYGFLEDYEYPKIVLYNFPLSNLTEEGMEERHAEEARKQLAEAAQTVERAGADILVIPCNTVHYFAEHIKKAISIPLLDIREEVARSVEETDCKSVGICASKSSTRWGIFNEAFQRRGIQSYAPSAEEQDAIASVILRVMQNAHGEKDVAILEHIAESFRQKGVEGMVLGCTELPLAIRTRNLNGFPLFDSSSILAESALDYAIGIPEAEKQKIYEYAGS